LKQTKPKALDENDKLKLGLLPANPTDDAVEVDVADLIRLDERSWEKSLRKTEQGGLTKDPGNAALVLEGEKLWRGCLGYDTLSYKIVWRRQPPIVDGMKRPQVGSPLGNHDWLYVAHWLATKRGQTFNKSTTFDALEFVAKSNPFNPLQQYLSQLQWDGQPRLTGWLGRYIGCDDNIYTRAVGRWWLVSAIARAMNPGCKADHMLVLEGKQGKRKSSALLALAGEWHLDGVPNFRDEKAVAETMHGKWIVEIAELEMFRGMAISQIKQFLTKQVDTYRPAYGRTTESYPRTQVFCGTTNDSHYLQDQTGARRFWPVKVGRVDLEALRGERGQLLAEAHAAWKSGERYWPEGEGEVDLMGGEQNERQEVDVWQERIEPWIDVKRHDGVTVGDVLSICLSIEPGRQSRADQMRVSKVLRWLKWEQRITGPMSRRERRYFPLEGES
jgi:putative DNA primase/helicase